MRKILKLKHNQCRKYQQGWLYIQGVRVVRVVGLLNVEESLENNCGAVRLYSHPNSNHFTVQMAVTEYGTRCCHHCKELLPTADRL